MYKYDRGLKDEINKSFEEIWENKNEQGKEMNKSV